MTTVPETLTGIGAWIDKIATMCLVIIILLLVVFILWLLSKFFGGGQRG
jgi:flagellar biogenesis protein FliO